MPFTTAIDVWIAGQAVATMAGMEEKSKRKSQAVASTLLWVLAIAAISGTGFILTDSPGFGGNPLQPLLVLAGLAAVVRYILVRASSAKNTWPLAMLLATVGAWIVLIVASRLQK